MRCLFTDTPIEAEMDEHAAPKRLGGRFTSCATTCATFNNAAGGGGIDAALVEVWRLLTVPFAPAMSAEHRSDGSLDVWMPGAEGQQFRISPGGGLVRANLHVLERDGRGRPWRFAGRPEAVRRAAVQLFDRPDPFVALDLPEIGSGLLDFEAPPVTPAAEFGALKAVLVAFDVTHGCNAGSWVRSGATAGARRLVADAVAGAQVDNDLYFRVMRGIDPELGARLAALVARRRRVGPVEHVMIACGSTTRRTIDAMWLVFGHEAWSFRLSDQYTGPVFTRIIGCDPARGGDPWFYDDVGTEWFLPAQAGLRTWTWRREEQPMNLVPGIQQARARAASHAWILGEIADGEGAPEMLFNGCVYLLRHGAAPTTVGEYCCWRMEHLYARDGRDVSATVRRLAADVLPADLAAHVAQVVEPVRAGQIDPWATEVATPYRRLVELVYAEHGPPMLVRFPTPPQVTVTHIPG